MSAPRASLWRRIWHCDVVRRLALRRLRHEAAALQKAEWGEPLPWALRAADARAAHALRQSMAEYRAVLAEIGRTCLHYLDKAVAS